MFCHIEYISFNCNGLVSDKYTGGGGSKFAALLTLLSVLGFPDIVGLQETHLYNKKIEQEWVAKLKSKGYRTFFSRGCKGSKGTAILIKINLPFKLVLEHEDLEGRYTILKGSLFGELVTLVSLYAPNKAVARKNFFTDLVGIGLRGVLYVMGDYNSVVDPKKDRYRSKAGKNGELIDFMTVTDIVDPWRERNREVELYSWECANMASRIDMIAISRAVRKNVVDSKYFSSGGLSDHCVVWLKINCGERAFGRDVFSIKPFVYKEEEFIDRLNDLVMQEEVSLQQRLKNNWSQGKIVGDVDGILEELEEGCDITKGLLLMNLQLDGVWWETFKNKIRMLAISIQRKSRVEDNREYGNLQREWSWSNSKEERARAKTKIVSKLREMTVKAIFEERLDEFKYNEKVNSTFLRRVSERSRKQFLESIVIDGGWEIKSRLGIQQYLEGKYSKLYEKVQPSGDLGHLFFNDLPRIEEGFINGGDITFEEMMDVVKESAGGKSPGIDGLGVEFYKLHFRKFGHWFTSMYNNCVKSGVVPESWRTAILKLIPKSEEEKPSFDNLRPLSLICDDKKIGAKCIAKRVRVVLPYIIDEHQTGGVAGRNITDNTLLIHLLIQFYTMRNEEGYVLSVDSKKAFDEVIREVLWVILERFGFPEGIIQQIKLMYVGARSKLVINGFLSEFITFAKGIRQGCPLSSILYALFIEPLAIRIRRELAVIGFKLPGGSEVKMVQHSDDMNFLVRNIGSIGIILNIVQRYGQFCGARINKLKSFIIRVGAAKDKLVGKDKYEDIKVIQRGEYGRILGINFGEDIKEYVDKNWELVREKCKGVLKRWAGERLSMAGKVVVLNNCVIPKINYVMSTLELGVEHREALEKDFMDFIWSGARNHEKSINVLCWPKSRGGLGLISLEVKANVLKLKRVKQYLNREEGNWENNAVHTLMRFHMDFYYRRDIDKSLIVGRNGGMCSDFTVSQYYICLNFYHAMMRGIVMFKELETASKCIANMDNRWLGEAIQEKFYDGERGKLEHWITVDAWGWSLDRERTMWGNIFHNYLDPKIQAFGWRVVHGVLLTKYRILGRQVKIIGDGKCACCARIGRDEDETIEHLLIDCWIAKSIWDRVNNALFRSGMQEIDVQPEQIVARMRLGRDENYIAAETAWAIWTIRLAEELDGERRTWKKGFYRLKSRLNFRKHLDIKLQKRRKWIKMEVFLRNLGVT